MIQADDLEAVLRAHAVRDPGHAAVLAPGRPPATFADVVAQVDAVRGRLAAWDIGRGDLVAGFAGDRPEMALACLAFPCSATFAPLHDGWHEEAYAALLDRLQPAAVVVPATGPHPLTVAAAARGIMVIGLRAQPGAPAGAFTLDLLRSPLHRRRPGRDHRELAYVLVTSGTTGQPKLVPVTRARVIRRGRTMGAWLRYTAADIGCHLVPLHLGHGVRSALLDPLLSGGTIACMPQGDPGGLLDAVETFGVNCFSAGFAVYRALLERGTETRARLRGRALRFARAGSGRLEPHELDALEDLLHAPVLVGYSSTETCTIAHDTLPPARRRGAVGVPVECEVRVVPTGANGHEPDGEVQVRGPLVFDGYLDDPALTAASFDDGWFRTGDLGRLDGDGYLHLTGRIKEQINRGGEKISPREIDRVLETLAGVREAATFGVPHPTLGEEVVSAVVSQPGATLDEAALLASLRARLEPTRVPRRIHVVDVLPRNPSGKLLRAELAARLAPHVGAAGERVTRVSATAALEADIAELWRPFVRQDELATTDDFFLAGGDSLGGARLLARVAARYGVSLPLRALFGEAATIAGMARVVEAHSALRTSLAAPPGFTITRRPRPAGDAPVAAEPDDAT